MRHIHKTPRIQTLNRYSSKGTRALHGLGFSHAECPGLVWMSPVSTPQISARRLEACLSSSYSSLSSSMEASLLVVVALLVVALLAAAVELEEVVAASGFPCPVCKKGVA